MAEEEEKSGAKQEDVVLDLSDSAPKYSREAIDKLHADWHIAQKKYEWTVSGSCGAKVFWNIFYFIIGTMVVVFLAIPFVLFELQLAILIVFSWLFTLGGRCCCGGGGKSLPDYWRLFIGYSRLHLSTVPPAKRGIIWEIGDKIIAFYQIAELPGAGGKYGLYNVGIPYQKLFGKVFPFMVFIAVTDYDEIIEDISDIDMQRENVDNVVGPGVRMDPEIKAYSCIIYYDSNDDRHKIAQDMMMLFCSVKDDSVTKLTPKLAKLPESVMKGYSSAQRLEAECIVAQLPYYFDNAEMTDEDIKTMIDAILKVGVIIGLSKYAHFLIGYYLLPRMLYKYLAKVRVLLVKYGGAKYEKVQEYAKKHDIEIECLLNAIATGTMIAGGCIQMATYNEILERVKRENSLETEKLLYESNKYNYALEVARWHSRGAVTAIISRKEIKCTIRGKEWTFPVGCNVAPRLAAANYDEKYFKDPDKFDIERDYGNSVSFNAQQKLFYGNNDLRKVASRHCPAYKLGVLSMKSVMDHHFGS